MPIDKVVEANGVVSSQAKRLAGVGTDVTRATGNQYVSIVHVPIELEENQRLQGA